jgi:excisionase family DNA binding protein
LERLLTVAELAARLGTSAQTVYRLSEAGRIPVVRVGTRHLRFDEAAVLEALTEKPKETVG